MNYYKIIAKNEHDTRGEKEKQVQFNKIVSLEADQVQLNTFFAK